MLRQLLGLALILPVVNVLSLDRSPSPYLHVRSMPVKNGAPVRVPRPRMYQQPTVVTREALIAGSIPTSLDSSRTRSARAGASPAHIASASLALPSHSFQTTLFHNVLTDTATTSTSHSHGPTPTPRPLKSSRQPKSKVSAIVGGGVGIVVVIFAFFLWRYLFLRGRRRKKPSEPAGRDVAEVVTDIEAHPPPRDTKAPAAQHTDPAPVEPQRPTQSKTWLRQQHLADEVRAVKMQHEELHRIQEKQRDGQLPPADSASVAPPPATQSKARLRQQYLANELRAVQRQHEELNRIQRKLQPVPDAPAGAEDHGAALEDGAPGDESAANPPAADPPRVLNKSEARGRQQYLTNDLRAIHRQHEALRRIEEKQRAAPEAPAESDDHLPVVEVSTPTDTAPPDEDAETAKAPVDLESAQRQNEMLRRRIRELEEQQHSDWARGLSDQPPPGYSE
ncbi:hypothetical protein DFH09DRAFT_1205332 [Mycena vulgaris]|nr:hypothetical protein DFH09DRAFT_1205332 [Mycena vulgaris]